MARKVWVGGRQVRKNRPAAAAAAAAEWETWGPRPARGLLAYTGAAPSRPRVADGHGILVAMLDVLALFSSIRRGHYRMINGGAVFLKGTARFSGRSPPPPPSTSPPPPADDCGSP